MSDPKPHSKFQGLLSAVRPAEDAPLAETPPLPPPAVSPPRRGRPRGKRSSADHIQVTAYLTRDTHRRIKIALLEEGEGREFSELVEALLQGWLRDN